MKLRWQDTRDQILTNHPQTLFGGYTFGRYGAEDIYGSYYNYTIQRSGVLGDDLAQYSDFVLTFYQTIKEVENATNYWHSKGKDLIALITSSSEVPEIYGTSPQTLADGAYSDIPGLNGIVYMNTYPIYPALKEAVKLGAIPAVYSWNDYPLFNTNTADVRANVGIFKANVIDAP